MKFILTTIAALLFMSTSAQNVADFYSTHKVLNYSDGEAAAGEIPQPEQFDPNFHIYLCFGQSNMEGNAKIESVDRQGIDTRFRMMAAVDMPNTGRKKFQWYAAVPPLCRAWTGLTPADYFGRTMVANLPDSIKVGVINVAVGGASIDLYDEDKTAEQIAKAADWFQNFCKEYDNQPMRRLMECAKRAQKVGVIKGILLHQGCTDNNQPTWPARVNMIYNRMLKELGLNAEDCPLIVGELMTKEDGGCCYHHNAIIDRIHETIPTAYYVSSAGCPGKKDKLHFTAEGYRILGKRYAEKMLEVQHHDMGLSQAYEGYFKVGVALNRLNLTDDQMAVAVKNFNSVTCENAMKPGELHPAEGVWKFGRADSIANFCRANNIPMRGHCLVWHNQFANWMMYDKDGNPVDKKIFYKRLREHIRTVVKRYKDVVYCWDVVNEAIKDDWDYKEGDSPFRNSKLYQLYGEEFIAKAFQFAHEADPKALLFYNDYSTVDPGKCARIYNMVKKMKEAGVPIHGIGMQGHYNIYFPSEKQLSTAIEKFSEIVDHIQITELDLRANQEMGGQLVMDKSGVAITPYINAMHADQYARIFKVLRKYKDKIDVVTFWNLSDRDSWVGTENYPLLIDKNLNYKDAYYAVRDFSPARDANPILEDFKPMSTNKPGQQYPMVNSQGYVRFHVVTPPAKCVVANLGGVGFVNLQKTTDAGTEWYGTSSQPINGMFHNCQITIDCE